MTKTPKSYLHDVISFGEKIAELLEEFPSIEEFKKDDRNRLAIERSIEIMCEAGHKLRKDCGVELKLGRRAYNFRGSLAHQYDVISDEKVYRFAISYVPQMVAEARALLDELNS